MTESHFRIAFLDDLDLTDGEEYRDGHGEDQSPVELDGHGTSSELETLATLSEYIHNPNFEISTLFD